MPPSVFNALFLTVFLGAYLIFNFLPERYSWKKDKGRADPQGYWRKKKGRYSVYATAFGVEFKNQPIYSFAKETWLDRFAKLHGFSTELQTGDQNFDEKIYITADDPGFAIQFLNAPRARALILEFFRQGCKSIHSSGNFFSVVFPGDKEGFNALYDQMIELRDTLKMSLPERNSFWSDSFAVRGLCLQLLILTVMAFASWSFLLIQPRAVNIYVDQQHVILHGIVWGLIGIISLMVFTYMLMHGSSRGHRLLLKNGLLIAIIFPFSGYYALSILNAKLDGSTPIAMSRRVEQTVSHVHHSKRSTWRSYHLILSPASASEEIALPSEIEVTPEIYQQFKSGTVAHIDVSRGYFGHPWYKSIRPQP